MTEQQTAAPAAPQASAAPAPAAPAPPPTAAKQPPWGDAENFNPEKAWELIQNLRNEKGGTDPSLKSELDQMRQTMQQQRDALATALGVKPEETSDADKLASQIETLRGQIVGAERRALAVEFKVPENMLTATDAAGMRQQAEALVAFAQASHYAAATTSTAPAATPPAFQQNPGQGQGGGAMTPEAQAAAEYEKYYPSK